MKNFAADLWNDLRAKRLWPVAALLLAGLIAVPVLLKKSAEEPAPAPAVAEVRTAPEPKDLKGLSTVRLEQSDVEEGSTLNTFDPANPFRPPERIVKNSSTDTGETSGGTTDPTSSDGVTTTDGTAPGGVTGGGDDGSGGGDDGSGGGDDGSGGGDGSGGTATKYSYVIDVTLTANGRTRHLKGLQKLEMLPSQANPLLLFLGASTNGGNAVFLVDSTLEPAGEGECKPSKADCAFLHLGPGSKHGFTDARGRSYLLKIDEIRKVKVGAGASTSAGVRSDSDPSSR